MGQRLIRLEQNPHFNDALSIVRRLHQAEFQTLFAGGVVRDAWLGEISKDIDIATSAQPDDIERLFPKTLAVGREFGTMVVVLESGNFEVTTFRKDGPYLDGRHPTRVDFTDAKEDAFRRDFTINALFYDPLQDKVLDFVDGVKDLEARLIRAVGNPRDRFREDILRILRAVRFAGQLGFSIESETWKAVLEDSAKITSVSQERILQELMKLLRGKYPLMGLQKLVESGLARAILPILEDLQKDAALWAEFEKRLSVLTHPESILSTIGYLTRNPEQLLKQVQVLKPSKQFVQILGGLMKNHDLLWTDRLRKRERIRLWASESWELQLEMSMAEAVLKGGKRLESWMAEYLAVCDSKGCLPGPFLTGGDLLEMGFRSGPELGRTLDDLYGRQLEGEIKSLEQARKFAESALVRRV